MTSHRRNEFDVTDRINTTDPQQVAGEVLRIYRNLFQKDPDSTMRRAFEDLTRLYRGENPEFYACDTDYHDIQHVLDVTLAMARLMDGCRRETNDPKLDEHMFRLGVISALYHDVGYLRHHKDTRHKNGAEYTRTHVGRGAHYLEAYLPTLGMGEDARVTARMLHYTGYEVPASKIRVAPRYQLIGSLLGSADIVAQMADRCYLEKLHDRLYPEFVIGGVTRKRAPDGSEQVIFESATDLIFKTPGFYKGATKRLTQDLGNYYTYLEKHFGGQNIYLDELDKNMTHARKISDKRDISLLRREMPETLVDETVGSSAVEKQIRAIAT
jgi:hypothetical protein